MKMKMVDLVVSITGTQLLDAQKFLVFEISAEDENGEDVDTPSVRMRCDKIEDIKDSDDSTSDSD